MAIYKYCSVKEVIAKVYRDLELKDTSKVFDMVEWSAEALERIGAVQQLETVIEKWSVTNYRIGLPCNFDKLNQIYYNGYPLTHSSSTFGNVLINPYLNSTVDDLTLEKLNGNPALLTTNPISYKSRDTFTINKGYITTSFETGDIYVSYDRIPVDAEGFPMIPDDANYKQALFWYIASMLQLPSWFNGDKDSRFEHCNQMWTRFAGTAGAKAMMPDLVQLESIKNSWVRLIPNINMGDKFFVELNFQESVRV